MKLYPFEEILDEHYGKIGSPKREACQSPRRLPHRRGYQRSTESKTPHPGAIRRIGWRAKSTNLPFGKRQKHHPCHPHPGIQSHGPPPLLRHGRPRENCPLLTTRLQAKARQLALAYNPPTAWSTAPGAASFSATRCSPSSRYSVGIAFRSYSNCVFTAAWSLAEIHPAGNSSLCACHTSS